MLLFLIGGVQKSTLIDYPQKIAAIVFTRGCNFRCGYCHNYDLLKFDAEPEYDVEDFFNFLKTRVGKLDGVVISGGEPTLQTGLYDFIKRVKTLGFDVKLDTNGTNPQILKKLVSDKMVNYFAMDIKAPFHKYKDIAGVDVNLDDIKDSIDFIMNSGVDYEFRTTVVKSQLSFDDFNMIGEMIRGAKLYYLQKFLPSEGCNPGFLDETSYSESEFESISKNLKTYVECVRLR